MFSFYVLRHAVKMMFHDIWATIRLTFLPMALGAFGGLLAVWVIGGDGAQGLAFGDAVVSNARTKFVPLVFTIIYLVCFCWAAVVWHRYILLAERPGAVLPGFDIGRVLRYLGRALLVGIAAMAVMLPMMLLIMLTLGLGIGDGFIFSLVYMVLFVILSAGALSLSLVLPATAIGARLTFGEALGASRGRIGSFLLLALVLVIVGGLSEFFPVDGWPRAAVSIVGAWFSSTLGLSVLTTLYGVLVEKRELT